MGSLTSHKLKPIMGGTRIFCFVNFESGRILFGISWQRPFGKPTKHSKSGRLHPLLSLSHCPRVLEMAGAILPCGGRTLPAPPRRSRQCRHEPQPAVTRLGYKSRPDGTLTLVPNFPISAATLAARRRPSCSTARPVGVTGEARATAAPSGLTFLCGNALSVKNFRSFPVRAPPRPFLPRHRFADIQNRKDCTFPWPSPSVASASPTSPTSQSSSTPANPTPVKPILW